MQVTDHFDKTDTFFNLRGNESLEFRSRDEIFALLHMTLHF